VYEVAYITTGSKNEADKLSRMLLEARLVACVNTHKVSSSYWWGGEIVSSEEFVLVCKSARRNQTAILALIEENHSYENPCVIFTKVSGGSKKYLDWVCESTKA